MYDECGIVLDFIERFGERIRCESCPHHLCQSGKLVHIQTGTQLVQFVCLLATFCGINKSGAIGGIEQA